MKLLFFGDFHERQKAPPSRIDDWPVTIRAKVEEIKAIAKKHDVVALLQPGDFLDSPKVPDDFLYEIIARWSDLDLNSLVLQVMAGDLKPEELYDKIKTNKPIIGVIGNHELFGYSMKTFNKTTLSLLNQIGFMHLATKENPVYLKSEDGFVVAITGANYHADIDKDPTRKDYIVEKKLGDFHIHMVHGHGTTQDFGTLFAHTKIQELGATQADLTIIGHDHIGFDPIEINGKWFVNPGAPVRLSNAVNEMNRIPKVMIIDIDKNGHSLKMIPLVTAQDSSLILDRSRIENKQEKEAKLNEIKNTVRAANVAKSDNIVEIVEHISENKDIEVSVKTYVRELISKKAERLSPEKKNPKSYYIKKMILENFQSHAYSEFDFSPGLNVFTGESRSGKTSIIRALGWIYEDYGGASRRFIKTGEKCASVTIHLSNDFIVTRSIEAKPGGFNGFKVYYPARGEWETMNTKAIDVVQEILGFTLLQVDKTDSGKIDTVPLNFLRQGNGWFFIGDDTSGSQRAKIIGTICGTNIADAAIREVEAKNKELSLMLRNTEKELRTLDVEISCMTHVDELSKDLTMIETLVGTLDELMLLKSLLESAKGLIDTIENDTQQFKVIKRDLDSVKQALDLLKEITRISHDKTYVKEVVNKLSLVDKEQKYLNKILVDLSHVEESRMLVDKIKEQLVQKISIQKLSETLITVTQAEKKLEKIVVSIPDTIQAKVNLVDIKALFENQLSLLSFKEKIDNNNKQQVSVGKMTNDLGGVKMAKLVAAELTDAIKQKQGIKEAKNSLTQIDSEIKKHENEMKEASKTIKSVKLAYMDIFRRIAHCPLCLQQITRDGAIAIAKNKFTHEHEKGENNV